MVEFLRATRTRPARIDGFNGGANLIRRVYEKRVKEREATRAEFRPQHPRAWMAASKYDKSLAYYEEYTKESPKSRGLHAAGQYDSQSSHVGRPMQSGQCRHLTNNIKRQHVKAWA